MLKSFVQLINADCFKSIKRKKKQIYNYNFHIHTNYSYVFIKECCVNSKQFQVANLFANLFWIESTKLNINQMIISTILL